ncbi:hypothetical protein BS17DRAFT_777538 [Gyrodon lividus]|nr:hypothetical protein BS17DRAFT_777538 [Gyrodon lividus]
MSSVYQRHLTRRLEVLHSGTGNITNMIRWDTQVSGPSPCPTYTCILYVAGIEMGWGSGSNQEVAKESAAARALARLPQPSQKPQVAAKVTLLDVPKSPDAISA